MKAMAFFRCLGTRQLTVFIGLRTLVVCVCVIGLSIVYDTPSQESVPHAIYHG